ncbi:MAG: VacJ family lipoprotein [Steroidobacteraceae bacterium]
MNPLLRTTALLFALSLAGCASLPPNTQKDPRDPFERANRATFAFNEALDRRIAKPIAKGYKRITPDAVETGISNFFSNAAYPTVLVNNVLQGKFKDALNDTGRLLLNTTLGLGGLLDPASAAGLARNDEDFGQTLGRWGVGSGAYLMIPLLGLRSRWFRLAGRRVHPNLGSTSVTTARGCHCGRRCSSKSRAAARSRCIACPGRRSLHVLVRSAYLQRREFQVLDGDVPVDESLQLEFDDDAATDPQPNGG